MKIEFSESMFATWFDLIPETPKEAAQLMRMAKSSKRIPPQIYTSFKNDEITSQVYIPKIAEEKQTNSINNYKKEK